jgi:Trypsin-like peptidase domain/AAA ATPase domain
VLGGGDVLQPENDSWAAIIYGSADDSDRLGTAVVIDDFRLLTCLHVIADNPVRERVWVAFPKAIGPVQRRLWPAALGRVDTDLDVAVLRLAETIPLGVTAAPLRCPVPHALRDKRWWVFGFAESRRGNSAYGAVGESLGDGYIRIDADRDATYRLRGGFSGGGVWSPDFGAVIGMVVRADEHGNGEAVTIYQIDRCLPEEKLRELTRWMAGDAGQTALAAWGWVLEGDPEGDRHWQPRARGVSSGSERGFRFRGRSAALKAICDWLDRDYLDRRALVVTGSPGAGKSAVLGRIVTTADPGTAAGLPSSDSIVRASPGSVACAVHAKGKTALEVAVEIARAASAVLPDRIEDFAPALRAALAERGERRFNVIIDALDEATAPAHARSLTGD